MTTSIAMCTYQGAPLLAAQLASFAAQSRLPDELVVCDDASTDDTAEIVRRFAQTAPFAVRLTVNEANLGIVKNFEKAIALCSGEVIFLADQDDVWRPNKIARIEAEFQRRADVGLIFSDARAVDAVGRSLHYRLWEAVPLTRRQQARVNAGRALEILLVRNVVTGATMAFRAAYRDLVLPIPAYCLHDAWIALLIAAVARCSALDEPLIDYRQHPRQEQGERVRGLYRQFLVAKGETAEKFALVADRHEAARQRLIERSAPLHEPHAFAALQAKIAHFRAKAEMRLAGRRLPLIAREWTRGHYRRYSLGWKSVAQDLFL